ncbi:MAG: hypothetical protein IT462_09005 [Planctomycetes bacterium]|nr:hypothetical protein [Planctomycetota bacterium]
MTRRTTTSIQAALGLIVLAMAVATLLAACETETDTGAQATQGPARRLTDSPPSDDVVPFEGWIYVFSGYTQLQDDGTHESGRRGWAVPGPALDYTIENPGGGELLLTAMPAVTVSHLHNVGSVSISQPSTSVIGPQQSVDFSITFTVVAEGPFAMLVTIPTNAINGQTGPAFEFKISGAGAPELFYMQWNSPLNQELPYINGTAHGNLETALLPSGWPIASQRRAVSALSPNGAYAAYLPPRQNGNDPIVYVQSSSGSALVATMPPTPQPDNRSTEFVWGQDAAGNQLLAIATNAYVNAVDPALSRRLYVCRISGTQPVVSALVAVTGYYEADVKRSVVSMSFSSDGSRLGFMVGAYYLNGGGYSQLRREIWGCAITNALPGPATSLLGTPGTPDQFHVNSFAWSDAATLVFELYAMPIRNPSRLWAVPISVNKGALVAGARVRQITTIDEIPRYLAEWKISPNGKRIAYYHSVGGVYEWPAVLNISTTAAPGGTLLARGVEPLNMGPDSHVAFQDREIAWSPDSKVVAFIGQASPGGYMLPRNVFAQRLATDSGLVVLFGNTLQLTTFTDGNGARPFASLVFSPESRRLLFSTGIWPNSTADLVLAPLSLSGNVTVFHAFSFIGDYGFRPGEGHMIAFAANTDLMVAPLSGRRLTTVLTPYRVNSGSTWSGVTKFEWMR